MEAEERYIMSPELRAQSLQEVFDWIVRDDLGGEDPTELLAAINTPDQSGLTPKFWLETNELPRELNARFCIDALKLNIGSRNTIISALIDSELGPDIVSISESSKFIVHATAYVPELVDV